MNTKHSIALKLLCFALLAFIAASAEAQVIKTINFSKSEGYTNGPLWGQPAIAGTNVWTPVSDNQGTSFITNDAVWYVHNITNEMMMVRPDQNLGTNTTGTIYWTMPFPVQKKGPVTVTWDWRFIPSNEIPADYDPTNNNYNSTLQGTDFGFTLSDSVNRQLGADPVFAVFNELSTPNRMGALCDARWNIDYSACDGGGNWNNMGPEYKDGKVLHMKLVAYFGDPSSPTNNSYDVWAQRDGEDVWHTTVNDTFPDGAFPMRRCPTDENGIDCITMWLNGGPFPTAITVDNFRVVGPDGAPPVELPAELGQTVNGFQDDFTGATRNPGWVAVGPGGDHYLQQDGVLKVFPSAGDPNHLLYMGAGASNTVHEVLARIRVLNFSSGDAPRGGVAVNVSSNVTGHLNVWTGINLNLRNFTDESATIPRHFRILDDLRAWGPQSTFTWTNEVWYWMRLKMQSKMDGANTVFAKVWAADTVTPEPTDWQLKWADGSLPTPQHGGFAGITACSNDGVGQFEVSYILIKSANLPSITVDFAPSAPTALNIPIFTGVTASTNKVAINWFGGGKLQSSAALPATWLDVTNTLPPLVVPITGTTAAGPQNFYRIKK